VKAIAKAGALASALSLAAAVRRKDAPISVVAGEGAVSFTCTDPGGITIKAQAAAEILEPGEAAVSADRISALTAGFAPAVTITVSTTENSATIACGKSRYRLPVCADAPAALAIDAEISSIEISGNDCLRLFETLPAAATELTRVYLNGVFLHSIDDRLVAVATDGAKLLRISIAARNFSTDRDLIVPTKAATALIKLIRQTKADKLTLRRSRTSFAVAGGGFEFVTRLIDSKYPAYESLVPAVSTNFVVCDRAELQAALARMTAAATVDASLLALCWDGVGPLQLFLARQPDAGTDFIAAETKGAAKIAMLLGQLKAMIADFNCERLHLEDAGPLVIRGEGEKLGLLMPCRWNFVKEAAAA
jgi:DNA polymerase III subunit beta